MDQQEGLPKNIPPLFIGENYAYWSVRMNYHLFSLGWKVWSTTKKEFKIEEYILPTDRLELYQYEGNEKSLNSILSGLTNFVFVKVMHCKAAKQAWDKLKIVYEWASKVKESKIHTYKKQFESIKMKE